MKAPFKLVALAYSGQPPDVKVFESFADAARECDRLNYQDDWSARVFDAEGRCVRDLDSPEGEK